MAEGRVGGKMVSLGWPGNRAGKLPKRKEPGMLHSTSVVTPWPAHTHPAMCISNLLGTS